jgi:diphthamide synthase (EF-2-diphthine--ammonia ligase)
LSLNEFLSLASTPLEKRLFREYGAVFATTAVPPSAVIFKGEDEVARFQSSLTVAHATIGEHEMELQHQAMEALLTAASQAESLGTTVSARSADSGRRSYQETVDLWLRNVGRGLDHWLTGGRISAERAESVRQLSPFDQVEVILELEDTAELYFGTYFDKTILSSVAAPGASQHLSLVAFDLAEYKSKECEQVLGENGWFRTVVSDLPHFTYLGRPQSELPDQGLIEIVRMHDGGVYRFWTPAIDRS